MTTRPLDLASKLRREPRSNDWLFFVNAGLIALFFVLFGSKFVLAPSLGVDFRLPEMPGANLDARPATHYLSVTDAGQIFVRDGLLAVDQLPKWLSDQISAAKAAKNPQEPVLLLQSGTGVPSQLLARIMGAAQAAGFTVRWAVEEPKKDAAKGAR